MNEDLKKYYENTQKPWSQLFYDMLKLQLNFAGNLDVLDFGSGFGILSNMLAENHKVIAVEPNLEMINNRFATNDYIQINGDIKSLYNMPDSSFDLIVCHNVLEYATEREEIINQFYRILRKDGILSIVKHNHYGRIMQKIVFDNNVEEAMNILDGGSAIAQNFGVIHYYDNEDILKWNNSFKLDKVYGLRTFWALQQNNEVKYTTDWQKSMIKAEIAVSTICDFIKISFYNHLLFRK